MQNLNKNADDYYRIYFNLDFKTFIFGQIITVYTQRLHIYKYNTLYHYDTV